MICTKIVATMGPACSDVETLFRLFEAGVDVCRLNFSHGSLDQHLSQLRNIREAAARFTRPIAVLGDLCGPKIRLGKIFEVNGTGGMPIEVGETLIIQRAPIMGANGRVSSIFTKLVDDVQIGDRVLIEDGLLRFMCVDKNTDELICNCTAGGVLKSSKGINLPNTVIHAPSITDRDWECVDWAVENRLDYLALSFVRSAADINELRGYLRDKVSDIHIVAKIEKAEAVQHIDEIIESADSLMVARGDLGVEVDLAQVPIIQKDIIRRCQAAGKPVIVATQMLQSMVDNSSPTRAEVSDVANAIFDGTDAVMLSGETSVGKFPLGTVHIMAHIAEVTENYLHNTAEDTMMRAAPVVKTSLHSGALARGAWRVVNDLKAKLVVIWTQTGATARIFSKHRFPVPIVALSGDHRTLRRMAIHYGVIPQEAMPSHDMSELIEAVDKLVQERHFAQLNDRIVIVAGWSAGTPGSMNGMVIHTVGQQWTAVPSKQMLRQMVKAEKD